VLPWTKHFGGSATDYARGATVAANGDITIHSLIQGFETIDFGNGPIVWNGPGMYDPVLARFDAAGNAIWSKNFPNASGATPWDVIEDGAGDLLLVGYLEPGVGPQSFGGPPITDSCGGSNTYFAVKLDDAGNHVWSNTYGCDAGAWGAVDPAHNLVLAGNNAVKKIDATGAVTWTRTYVAMGQADATNIAINSITGDIFTIGTLVGGAKIDFGGGPLIGGGMSGCWLLKLDSGGNQLWSKMLNPVQPNGSVNGVVAASDSTGALIVAGYLWGDADLGGGVLSGGMQGGRMFLAKYDAMGSHVWSKVYGDGVDNSPGPGNHGLAVGPNNNVLMVGTFWNSVDFGGGLIAVPQSDPDAPFVAAFDPSGSHLWSAAVTTTSETAMSCKIGPAGNAVVFGDYSASVSFGAQFGGAQYPSPGGLADLFVASFEPW
jgi:hypothetical protein